MAKKFGIILLVFVCFYLGAHFWMRARQRAANETNIVTRLADCDPNEVREIKIFKQTSDSQPALAFSRVDKAAEGTPLAAQLAASEWRILSPRPAEADATILTRLSSMFCELYDPAATSEQDYVAGAAPVDRVVFELAGKGSRTLSFGPSTKERMVVAKYQEGGGSPRVVKIQPKILQLASLPPTDYVNLRVMRMSADNINLVKVFDGPAERFTLERRGDGWRVLRAGKEVGAGNAEAQKYVNRLTTLRALKADEGALNPTRCEKNQSRVSVEFAGVGNRAESVFFQYKKENKGGVLSACDTARDSLFVVHRDMIPYLETSTEKVIN